MFHCHRTWVPHYLARFWPDVGIACFRPKLLRRTLYFGASIR
jgi:hypothetical protein